MTSKKRAHWLKAAEVTAGIAFWVIAAALILHYKHQAKPAPATKPASQAAAPCSTDQNPCIQLTAEDGTKYKLNDFRFLPDHCIAILSLPDRTSRKVCGNYKLDWIGPDTSHDIKGQNI